MASSLLRTRSLTVSGSRLRARSLNVSRASSGSMGGMVRERGMTSPSWAFGLPAFSIWASHGGNRTMLRSPISVSGSMVACTSAGSGTSESMVISTRTWSSSISTAFTVPIDTPIALTSPNGYRPTATSNSAVRWYPLTRSLPMMRLHPDVTGTRPTTIATASASRRT